MARMKLKVSPRMLFTWLLLAGIVVYLAPSRLTGSFHFAYMQTLAPVLKFSRNVATLSTVLERQLPADMVSRADYNRLHNARENMKAQLIEKQRELDRLSRFRNRFPALNNAAIVPADVINISKNRLGHRMTINRGRDDGLVEGLYVLGDLAVIGVIDELSGSVATVKLITCPSAAIFAMTENATGVLTGSGDGKCLIQLAERLPAATVVYAGKRPGLLDAPMVVGTVVESRTGSAPLLYDVTVEPAADIDRLSHVSVLIMNPGR